MRRVFLSLAAPKRFLFLFCTVAITAVVAVQFLVSVVHLRDPRELKHTDRRLEHAEEATQLSDAPEDPKKCRLISFA